MREPIHPGETLREGIDALSRSAADRGAGEPHQRDFQRPGGSCQRMRNPVHDSRGVLA